MEAGRARGHHMMFVNIKYCYMNVTYPHPQLYYKGNLLDDVEAVIPRIKPAMTFYGTAVARQFEMMEIYTLNKAIAISRSRDKLRSLQLLSKKGVPMPNTGFAHSPTDTNALIKMVGGAPLIVKLLEGTQGKGVVLAETNKAAESVINAFKSIKANILVQEFIKEAGGEDIRCFVIGGKVVAGMKRIAKNGDFRSNIHLGGIPEAVKLTPDVIKIAENAAKAMDLEVAGVDIMISKKGPKVLEVNSSPGLEGIESVTGLNIADMMIAHLETHIK